MKTVGTWNCEDRNGLGLEVTKKQCVDSNYRGWVCSVKDIYNVLFNKS
jgi:hypothetical protein